MGVIFIFSTDHFSGMQTSRFIGPILKWIMPGISDVSIASFQLIVRKFAHLAEYAILSILICRALARSAALDLLPLGAIAQAVLIAGVYAVTDEWHQSGTSERMGSWVDVGIDITGAVIGAVFFAWFTRRQNRVND